ncbi:PREDICTED: putative uncharacterized protein CXorf30 homolog, partial [Mesitornis unicolor]|uniref:putative uncharacterized protein CXorf30 homolog n=1 Tax=Mesitornis unicolor TaxID=54374 RepID=UPI00052908AA
CAHLHIPLFNPTYETLVLEIVNSNPSHFSTKTDPKHPLIVAPHSTTKVPVQFCPSALGKGNHKASITFKCSQLKEWIFYLSGIGLPPQLMEPTNISACIGQQSAVKLSFRNPTSENVLIDLVLTGILLAPKEKLDIPVLFMPDTMQMYKAVVVIHVMRQNGENWPYEDSAELNKDLKSQGKVFLFPGFLCGLEGLGLLRAGLNTVVRCRARQRLERRVEVPLSGVVLGATAMPAARNSAMVNTSQTATVQEGVQVTNGFSATVKFLYELQYESNEIKSQLESLVGVHLVQTEQDTESGITVLIFNIVFTPSKPMRNKATLVVQSTTGGVWKFPMLFIAMEPEVDDVINIEAVGLNKESIVGFKLTSQTSYPEPFTACFLAGSDPDFSVLPQTGELLPAGTVGTHITVGFKPRMYGKKHKATLVIQTQSMQWMYDINGLPPQTVPHTSPAKVVSTSSYIRSATVRQRNFILENLKLITTGVSSPIKGAPLLLRTKYRKL